MSFNIKLLEEYADKQEEVNSFFKAKRKELIDQSNKGKKLSCWDYMIIAFY